MAWREARKNADFKSLLPTLSRGADDHAPGRRGQGGGARPVALRRAARRVRAGRPLPRASTRCSPSCKASCRPCCGRVMERQQRSRRAAAARRAVPGRGAAQAGRGADPHASASTSHHGRLDVSAHPFTGGTADDVRITTRYDEDDFARALMGVLHETGHALYEAGLPRDWRRQPVGNARGMVLHESQSLLMEMQACRCRRLHRLRRAAHARRLRQERAGLGGRQHPSHLYARRAGLHPRRRRRGDLSAAHHAALPAGARDAGGRPRARRPAGRLERGHARAAGHRAAERRGGLPAGHPLAGRRAGAISRPTRWGRWRRPSSLLRPARPMPDLHGRPSARAISRPCWAGCAPMCTARARLPTPTRS